MTDTDEQLTRDEKIAAWRGEKPKHQFVNDYALYDHSPVIGLGQVREDGRSGYYPDPNPRRDLGDILETVFKIKLFRNKE